MRILMETLEICGIEVEVERKKIKNLHIYIHPPYGNVTVSAPLRMSDEAIAKFVTSKISWIEKHQSAFQKQKSRMCHYLNGDEINIWGKRYNLAIIPSETKTLIVSGNDALLLINENSTFEQREKVVNAWHKDQLEPVMLEFARKWEEIIGVKASSYVIRDMRTRWGSCNTSTRRICINLQLAKKSPEFLEYVVVHELCHLLEGSHNEVFKAYMDKYLPNWRYLRKELNEKPIGTF